jgi:FAD/FMN-containing dehydrogenase/Fe-S oxidoreductase
VVFPRHRDDVLATLATCRELGVPVVSRGGGTSIAGNAIGSGVILDFSRHLNRVLMVDPDEQIAIAQPGAVLDAISAAGARHGLRFGPDPSTHSRATIGGALANNSCGARALGFGRTDDNTVSMEVALADGTTFVATDLEHAPARLQAPLTALVGPNLALLRTEFGRFSRQGSGYSLHQLLPERGANLARLLVGSEGTLAVTLEATVRMQRQAPATALVALGYADMPSAAEAVPAVLRHQPSALEGLDARLVEVARRRGGPAATVELPAGRGWLFAETTGADEGEARAAGARLMADSGCLDGRIVLGADAAVLWRLREDGAGLVGRTPDGRPAWPGWEDAAVPPAQLAPYLRDFDGLLNKHGLDGLVFGHFGDGCVHARIDFPFDRDPKAYGRFVHEAAELVGRYGGSMSGEHGDGRARSELLPLMYSPAAIEAFGRVKAIFDPTGLLNPGVLVDPVALDSHLRVPVAGGLHKHLGFAYPDDGDDLANAVHRCVGIGRCRADNTGADGVMCPSYLATRDEKDSTRGRARVLQELANGALVRNYRAPELAESLDLCLSCKGCSHDCPAGVDIATYKAEVLYQRYRRRLRPRSHYSLGWLPRWARLASRAPRLANAATRRPALARLLRRGGGIDQRRGIPAFAPATFREWFAATASQRRAGAPEVMLWVDTFTEYFTPEVGQAAVEVLEAAGRTVRVAPEAVCCGLTWISTGQLDGARRQLRGSLAALSDALGDGIPIVGLELSCTTLLRHDAARLLPGDQRAKQLAASTRTLAEFLTELPDWTVPDLSGTHGVAQPHCHQNAQLGWQADQRLLAQSGAEFSRVGGCCGLAGNFGMEEGHYDVSVAVARHSLLPAVEQAPADAVILADGFSCRTQLDQLAGTGSIHLAQLLARQLSDRAGPR